MAAGTDRPSEESSDGQAVSGLDRLPDTAAGRWASWVLPRLPYGGDAERAAELLAALPPSTARRTVQKLSHRMRGVFPPLRIDAAEQRDSDAIELRLLDVEGKDWSLHVRVDEGEPSQLSRVMLGRALAPGVTVEGGEPIVADMIAIEAAVAIEAAGNTEAIDRSRSLEDHLALMGHVYSVRAYVDGAPAAMSMAALRPLPLADGRQVRVLYAGRDRVHPAFRGRRLSETLKNGELPADFQFDGQYFMIDVNNQASLARVPSDSRRLTYVNRYLLATAELGGPPAGRQAEPNDADHVARLLHATHGHALLWPGGDPEWLRQRLSRTGAYSWRSIRFTDNAAVGTWLADERRMISVDGSPPQTHRRALVLDYAVLPGGDADLAALLRSASTEAAGAGLDQLVVTAAEGAPGSEVFSELARTTDRLAALTHDLPLPDDIADRTIWIDPVYV